MGPKLNFFAIDFDAPYAKVMDWVLSAASLAWGFWLLYLGEGWYAWLAIGLGVLGCWLSWWRPLPRIQGWLRSRFVKKRR